MLTLYSQRRNSPVISGLAGILASILSRQAMNGQASLNSVCPNGDSPARQHFDAVLQPLDVRFWLAHLTAKGHHAIGVGNSVSEGLRELDSHFCNTKIKVYRTKQARLRMLLSIQN